MQATSFPSICPPAQSSSPRAALLQVSLSPKQQQQANTKRPLPHPRVGEVWLHRQEYPSSHLDT